MFARLKSNVFENSSQDSVPLRQSLSTNGINMLLESIVFAVAVFTAFMIVRSWLNRFCLFRALLGAETG